MPVKVAHGRPFLYLLYGQIYHNTTYAHRLNALRVILGAIYNLDDQKTLQKKMKSIKISSGKLLIFFEKKSGIYELDFTYYRHCFTCYSSLLRDLVF